MSSKSLLNLWPTVSENVAKSYNSYCCMFKCLSLYPPEMLKCTDILNSKDARFSGDNKTQVRVPLNLSVMEGTTGSCDGGDENKQGS